VNDDLLTEARQAQERLIDAERDVEVARAEFHRAVRRLHLRGTSLRELAAKLGLSHQRVHQIVEEDGGSRRWVRTGAGGRSRTGEAQLWCTFCGKSQKQVRKLIAGPGVFICDGCTTLAQNVLGSGQPARTELGSIVAVPDEGIPAKCCFCGKERHQVTGLAGMPYEAGRKPGKYAAICSQCLDLCQEIIAEDLEP
jgi:hypothetical protein